MFGKPYARGRGVFPGTCVRVLKIKGKCSCLRAKAAHISGHLPLAPRPAPLHQELLSEKGQGV